MSVRFFLITILLGFLFRIWIGSFATQDVIFDMSGYVNSAIQIQKHGVVVECCLRNNGYSLFLAVLNTIFGPDNLTCVRIIQACLDTSCAFLLFFIGKKVFGTMPGYISYALYLTNPLTSSYTGLRLGEILTIWIICLTLFFVVYEIWKTSMLFWIWIGFLIGTLLFLKQSFFSFSLITLLVFPFLYTQWKHRMVCLLFLIIGFLCANSYTLIGNMKQYDTLSLTPPYNTTWVSLYSGIYMPRWPEIDTEFYRFASFPEEYKKTSLRYNKSTNEEKLLASEEYRKKYFQAVISNPSQAASIYIQHIIWMWDKYHLFYYHDPFHPDDMWILRSINIVWICFAFVGCFSYRKEKSIHTPYSMFSCVLLGMITLIFPLVNNETRLSLYGYPIVFLFAGYGISSMKAPKSKSQAPNKSQYQHL